MEPELPMIRVVDLSTDTSQEEAERLLNAPYAAGYYLERLIPDWSDAVKARAVYRKRKREEQTAPPDSDSADALLRAHPKMSVRELQNLLNAHGVKRSRGWVHKQRTRIQAEA